jgi:hypothetical protein
MSKPEHLLPVLFFVLLVTAVLPVSCSQDSPPATADFTDNAVTELANLGFLCATGHGTTKPVRLPDPDHDGRFLYPGGVVLRDVFPGGPAAVLGLKPGDVVIRVLEDFLPSKEDPTIDLLARIESAHSAGKTGIAIGFLRGDDLKEGQLDLDRKKLPSLDQGDFQRNERFALAASDGLEYLKKTQKENGSFPIAGESTDARLAVTALAGLAFLGGSDGDAYEENLSRCITFVEAALEEVGSPRDEDEASPGDEEASPEADRPGHMGAAFATFFLAEYTKSKNDLPRLATLAQAVQKVISAQQEDGGWDLGAAGQELGYNERTLATQYCLQALGLAERSGVQVENETIEKACAFLKAHTNDGDVGFVPEKGFDRRAEAGRLAGIVVALRSIACDFNDPYMNKLFKYYLKHAHEITRASVDETIHLLSAALLSRQKGLPQWSLFSRENQVLLLSLKRPDGSFAALPKPVRKPIPFFEDVGGSAWRTAVYTLIFLLQEERLPVLVANASSPLTRRRDADGKMTESASPADPAETPEKNAMTFTSVDDAIEFLKKMGLDEDDPQIKQLKEMQEKTGKDQ